MEVLVIAYIFIIGLFIGSFLNVLIDRLPNEESILGRSHCDFCKKKLEPIDLIPVFSYLFLGGKCRRCKKKLSFQYPAMEIFTGVAFVLTWMFAPVPFNVIPDLIGNPQSSVLQWIPAFARMTDGSFWVQIILLKIAYLGLISTLIVVLFADLKYQIIPDSMQVSFAIFSFVILFLQPNFLEIIGMHIVAAVAATLSLFLLFAITRGRGMGFGDVKFAFGMGLLLGLKSAFLALYLSFVSGAIVGVVLIVFSGLKMKSKIAFGPYLILGTVIMIFFGEYILSLVHKFYGF